MRTPFYGRFFLNRDLERLVETYYRLQECEPGQERKLLATYRRLFQEAATRLPAGRLPRGTARGDPGAGPPDEARPKTASLDATHGVSRLALGGQSACRFLP